MILLLLLDFNYVVGIGELSILFSIAFASLNIDFTQKITQNQFKMSFAIDFNRFYALYININQILTGNFMEIHNKIQQTADFICRIFPYDVSALTKSTGVLNLLHSGTSESSASHSISSKIICSLTQHRHKHEQLCLGIHVFLYTQTSRIQTAS